MLAGSELPAVSTSANATGCSWRSHAPRLERVLPQVPFPAKRLGLISGFSYMSDQLARQCSRPPDSFWLCSHYARVQVSAPVVFT
jgi:hypothetical protein